MFTQKISYTGESKSFAANTKKHLVTAGNTLLRCLVTTSNYIRFQWAFAHPRNWTRYTPVTEQTRARYKDRYTYDPWAPEFDGFYAAYLEDGKHQTKHLAANA